MEEWTQRRKKWISICRIWRNMSFMKLWRGNVKHGFYCVWERRIGDRFKEWPGRWQGSRIKDPGISFVWVDLPVLDSRKDKVQVGHCRCGKCRQGNLIRRESHPISPHVQFLLGQPWPLRCLILFSVFSCDSLASWISSLNLLHPDRVHTFPILLRCFHSTNWVEFFLFFFICSGFLLPLKL